MRDRLLALVGILASCGPAAAHHSFAAYYAAGEDGGLVVVEGLVETFRFTNPHGIIQIRTESGLWTAETLAPAMLQRRGWSKDALHTGDKVRAEGLRARDGSKLLRLQTIARADGTVIGAPR